MSTAIGGPLRILAGSAHPELADPLATELGVEWSKTNAERFADGELHVAVNRDVPGAVAFIAQPTSPWENDHPIELALMIDATSGRGRADRGSCPRHFWPTGFAIS